MATRGASSHFDDFLALQIIKNFVKSKHLTLTGSRLKRKWYNAMYVNLTKRLVNVDLSLMNRTEAKTLLSSK